MKAVVWTDFLQSFVTLGSCLAIIILGLVKVGGFNIMLDRSEAGGRLKFFEYVITSQQPESGSICKKYILDLCTRQCIHLDEFTQCKSRNDTEIHSTANFEESENTARLPSGRTRFDSRRGHSQALRLRESCQMMPLAAGFLGDIPLPPPLHSGASPYLTSLVIFNLGFFVAKSLSIFIGLLIYSNYYTCDPITSKVS
ncbi:hypothetical protein PR048_032281 [Dryococelus australis]|uniref:Uncharacterized protein n=1 Tax=Dryococelus australis TaxID=614101 RepID=A0ABQ9G1S0_9NEOP|nr:hypothetical protein PR048_032281 [Dryococelus australis]